MVTRLIEAGLMFGGLYEVSAPALVDRYRRAMRHLTGRETRLDSFHVDLSGYAPEIGDELGDHDYLNPQGCNRQFILLSLDQARAPLLNARFSTSRRLLTQFFEANRAALFALTARDAVVGEIENSVYRLERPADLLGLGRLTVRADTAQGHLEAAEALRQRIARFRDQPGAWHDDKLIAEMIALAGQTGDVTKSPLMPRPVSAPPGNFWTAHFGGAYLFADVKRPFVIANDPERFGEDFPLPVHGTTEADAIARAFQRHRLAEPIVSGRNADSAAILRQKMDFLALAHAAEQGRLPPPGDLAALRRLARQEAGRLPPAFHGLARMLAWAEGGAWPELGSDHQAYFYGLRGAPGPDRDLVNMALAELAPLDLGQLFICHKELFYARYKGWSDAKQEWVVAWLAAEYLADKPAMRARLFGTEEPLAAPDPAPHAQPPAARRPGPWG